MTNQSNGRHQGSDGQEYLLDQSNYEQYPNTTFTSNGFDIRDHIDKLEHAPKKRYRYICPVCGDDNLGINLTTGAYQCWSNQCKSEDIRNAIAPLSREAKTQYRKTKTRPKTNKEKDRDATLATAEVELKANEIALAVEGGYETNRTAMVNIAAWAKEHGHNVYAAQQLLKELLGKLPAGDEDTKPKLLKDYELIESRFGDRLRYNLLTKEVELDGKYFDPSIAKLNFSVDNRLNLKSGREDISDIVVRLAKQHSYSPVTEYLDKVRLKHGNNISILGDLAQQYFGTSDLIHQTVLVKFLIAAVARAYDPGCQVDTALILQGKQGYGKSNFFRTLASDDWFDDSLGNASDKDERLKLHSAWFIEWAELETVFKRKDIAQVKAFMTTKTDVVRVPYGRSIERWKRSSVFVGTTNESAFLADSTGNRRFWIIPVRQAINIERLKQERDRIWAGAVELYRKGYPWWLSDEEESRMEQEREEYRSLDPWHNLIAEYVEHLHEITTDYLLEHVCKVEVGRRNKSDQNRVGAIMRELGWEYKNTKRNGEQKRQWVKQ